MAGGLASRSDATTRKKYLPSARTSPSNVREFSCSAGAEQLPLRLVFAAEVEGIDQAVAVGIFGLPADVDLLRGGARERLRGRAGGGAGVGIAGVASR